jgi:hypothetical protein
MPVQNIGLALLSKSNSMNTRFKPISITLITVLMASMFASPARAVYDIAIARTSFGATVASNVGVSLSGFDENLSYQATIKFVDTNNLDVTNGTLAATQGSTSLISGYLSYSGTKLGFKGTYAAVAAALSTVTWNPDTASGDISIRIGIAPYAGDGKFYDANSGHFYQYVSTAATWGAARAAAEATNLYGYRGYLAEINSASENSFIGSETSATNIWIGATEDATTASSYSGSSYSGEAGQRWIWAGAVEGQLPVGTGLPAHSSYAAFSSWSGGEPNNDAKPGADCAVTNWGTRGLWNDLACTSSNGYLIEFGGRPDETFSAAASTLTQTVVAKAAVTLGNFASNVTCTFGVNCSFPMSLTDPTANAAGTFTYASSNTASTTVSAVSGGATVSLLGAGSSTITATFTPTNTVLYAGNTKSFTIAVTATAPIAPTGLRATAADNSVALSWTAGSNGGSAITDYLVEYSANNSTWSTFADGTSNGTSATVTGLTNGSLYFFRVSAVNVVNTSPASSVASATPATPPSGGGPAIPTPNPSVSPTTPKPKQTKSPTFTPLDVLTTKPPESGTLAQPAPLVERIMDSLPDLLKPVIVSIFASPPADADILSKQKALDFITSTADKRIGDSPSLVLYGNEYQPSKVIIVENTTAQVVAPNGGVLNLQATSGTTPIEVNALGRVQMVQSNSVVAQGNGLAPNSEFAIYLFSEPRLLGIGKTNKRGRFFASFDVKNEIPLGNHTLQVNGLLADGRTSSVSMPVSVVDSLEAPDKGALSETVPVIEEPSDEITETFNWCLVIFAFIFVVIVIFGLRLYLAFARRRRK